MTSKIFKSRHIRVEIRSNLDGRNKDIQDKYDREEANKTLVNEWLIIKDDIEQELGIVEVSASITKYKELRLP